MGLHSSDITMSKKFKGREASFTTMVKSIVLNRFHSIRGFWSLMLTILFVGTLCSASSKTKYKRIKDGVSGSGKMVKSLGKGKFVDSNNVVYAFWTKSSSYGMLCTIIGIIVCC